jgi:hypothetical protein
MLIYRMLSQMLQTFNLSGVLHPCLDYMVIFCWCNSVEKFCYLRILVIVVVVSVKSAVVDIASIMMYSISAVG